MPALAMLLKWPGVEITVIPAPGPVEAALDLTGTNIGRGATIVAIGPLRNLALFHMLGSGRLRSIAVRSPLSYHA